MMTITDAMKSHRLIKRPIQRGALLKIIRTFPLIMHQPSLAAVRTLSECSNSPMHQANTQ
jgi:hypothetical protein